MPRYDIYLIAVFGRIRKVGRIRKNDIKHFVDMTPVIEVTPKNIDNLVE